MRKPVCFKQPTLAISLAATFGVMLLPIQAMATDQDVDSLFKESMYLRETGKTFSAIDGMESILQSQPTLQRVRLELAVSYYRVMNFERAKAEAKTVLDNPKTPDNVKLAVQVFMAQIEQEEALALKQKNRFEPSLSVGLIYDSNVNAGPESSLIPGSLFTVDNASLGKNDWGSVLQAGLGYTYQSPDPVRFGESAARFLWKSQANIYQRTYSSEGDYNLTIATLATGPAWQAANKWRANVNMQVDYLMQGGHELGTYLTAAPSYTWQLKNAEVTCDAQYTNKNFSRSIDENRDSDYVSGGVTYSYTFNKGKAAAQVGAHAFSEDAKTAQYTNDGYEWFAGASFMAWTNGNVYARYTQNHADYDDQSLGAYRADTTHTYEVGFGHSFKTGTLNGWNLNGSVSHTEDRSNYAIYKYQRDLVMLTLGRTF